MNSNQERRKIGIFRALQLGDMLCAMPAIRALREHFPLAEIVLIGLPWSTFLQQRYPALIDRLLAFPGFEGLPEQPFDALQYAGFLTSVRKENFDLLLQMQGNGTIVNAMMESWNAKQLAGFHQAACRQQSALFCEYPGDLPEPLRHLALMRHLGIREGTADLFFPLRRLDLEEIRLLELPRNTKGFVCVHPGSRGAYRQWPPEYFAELADRAATKGFMVLLTGTSNERSLTRKIQSLMQHPAIDLSGRTSIGGMAWLLHQSRLLIANCTGVSHIAAAVKTPSIIISMDGEPERWGPLDRQRHRVFDWLRKPDFAAIVPVLDEMLRPGVGSREFV